MRQFINGSEAAFIDLATRARGACVVFYGEELPAGTVPTHGRIGFESNPRDGSVTLLVERGAIYQGTNRNIREWLAAGEKRFANFAALRAWLQADLASAYTPPPASSSAVVAAAPPLLRAESLTNLDEVRSVVQDTYATPPDEAALFAALSAHVRGQDEPVRRLARIVCNHVSRLRPRRPATIFILGPTGVGKTKTAEILPRVLNELLPPGAAYQHSRLDMSEYQESHRVSQLLGAPQGYIGYNDGAQLLDALAANPKTIVLFDEIEKAHPHILRALMNAMDAGRLSAPARATAGLGRVVDCRQAIFIFTSNLDSADILTALAAGDSFADPVAIDDVCRRHLRTAGIAPELLGRVGTFLVFRPLSPETRAEIVTLAVARVAEEYDVTVARVEPSVIAHVLAQTRDEGFGARPDERLVDDLLGDAFIRAARAFRGTPVMVCGGPPFSCMPVEVAA